MQGLLSRPFGCRWLAWLASVCMAWLMVGCGPRYEPPLMVGTNIWAGYEPLYLARDLGYYDGQPLRLVEHPQGPINWLGTRWNVAPYDIWVAEQIDLNVGNTGHHQIGGQP